MQSKRSKEFNSISIKNVAGNIVNSSMEIKSSSKKIKVKEVKEKSVILYKDTNDKPGVISLL